MQTKTHAIDFAKPTEKSWEDLASVISGIEVGVLGGVFHMVTLLLAMLTPGY